MTPETRNGADQSAASNVHFLRPDRLKHSNAPQKPQASLHGQLIAEAAFLKAKREYIDDPSDANLWACGVLEKAFRLVYGVAP